MTTDQLSLCIKLQKLVRHIADRFFRARLCLLPGNTTKLVESRCVAAFRTRIFLNKVETLYRNKQFCSFGKGQKHEFTQRASAAGFIRNVYLLKTLELTDSVIYVNYVIAGFQIAEI